MNVYVNFPYYTSSRNSMGVFCKAVCDVLEMGIDKVTFCSITPADLGGRSITVPALLRTGVGRLNVLTLYAAMAIDMLTKPRGQTVIVNISQEFIYPLRLDRSAVIVHDTIQDEFPRSRLARLMITHAWSLCRRAATVISISDATRLDLEKRGVTAHTAYANPFDLAAFEATAAQGPPPSLAAIWCGTNAPHKNIDLFLALAARQPRDRFAVIVPAFDAPAIRAKAPANVEVLCDLSDNAYRDAMASAAIFVSTSAKEGFGRPAMEAIILGRAALLSDIPIYREIYDGYAMFYDLTVDALEAAYLRLKAGLAAPSAARPDLGPLLRRQGRFDDVLALLRPLLSGSSPR